MVKPLVLIRTIIFYIVMFVSVVFWGTLSLIICPFLRYEHRFFFITLWSGFIVFCARWICSIHYRIEGAEHIPSKPTVVVAKHQSTWETLYFQNLFSPTATVLKKELIAIPFFGWSLRLLDPIIIDRGAKKQALSQIVTQGIEQMSKHRWIVIYPEGTRTPPGENSRIAQGAFVLAKKANTPIVPIVHNSGEFWHPKKWLKHPGTITVRIGKPISTNDHSIEEIICYCANWMTENMHDISDLEKQNSTKIIAKSRPKRFSTHKNASAN